MKISIQGYKGSFHHQVAKMLLPEAEVIYRATFDQVFSDVAEGRVDYSLAAIENSIAGAILENYDRLRRYKLQIVGEYYLRIVMNLIAYPGQSLADIREVRSHPMAIKQCAQFLESQPQMRAVEHADTAQAVEEIMQERLLGVAGIAGVTAAEEYSAEVLQSGIETDPQNFTRFLLLSRQNVTAPTLSYAKNGKIKTSLYLQTAHEPGSLLRALEALEKANANMTMLVSRPVVGQAWRYGFYIDFEMKSQIDSSLSASLRKVAEEVKVLGVYDAYAK